MDPLSKLIGGAGPIDLQIDRGVISRQKLADTDAGVPGVQRRLSRQRGTNPVPPLKLEDGKFRGAGLILCACIRDDQRTPSVLNRPARLARYREIGAKSVGSPTEEWSLSQAEFGVKLAGNRVTFAGLLLKLPAAHQETAPRSARIVPLL